MFEKEEALRVLVLTGIDIKVDNPEEVFEKLKGQKGLIVDKILESAEKGEAVADDIEEHMLRTFNGDEGHDSSSCDEFIEECGFYDDEEKDENGFTELDRALGKDGGEGLDGSSLDEAIIACHDPREVVEDLLEECESFEDLVFCFPGFFVWE